MSIITSQVGEINVDFYNVWHSRRRRLWRMRIQSDASIDKWCVTTGSNSLFTKIQRLSHAHKIKNLDPHLVWLSEHLTKPKHLHKMPLEWGFTITSWRGGDQSFSCKSIREWKVMCSTLICVSPSRGDTPECHFHLNLLESDYWRCRAAERGENGLHYKVLGKGPAINQKAGSM